MQSKEIQLLLQVICCFSLISCTLRFNFDKQEHKTQTTQLQAEQQRVIQQLQQDQQEQKQVLLQDHARARAQLKQEVWR